MQETEINKNLDHNLLSFPGGVVETEGNSECSRVAIYIGVKVDYRRRQDLEGVNSNLIVIEMNADIVETTSDLGSRIYEKK